MITSLQISHVRGLEETSMSLGPSVNMWVGDNGAGKTSVLEAVSILSFGRSFVSSRVRSVIAFDQDSMTVFGKVKRGGTDHRLAVQVGRNDERKLRVDGVAVRGQGALSKILPVLQITPHISDMVSGSPSDRRRFVDWGAFHWSDGNGQLFSGLRRAVLQRNAVLRGGILSEHVLFPWEQQVAQYGEAVNEWREMFVNDLKPSFQSFLAQLGLEVELEIVFRSGWGEKGLSEALAANRNREIKARSALVGPQRADLEILRRGVRASDTLSRGQLKICNLALILAQLSAAGRRGLDPVLCLDDPGAELDEDSLSRVWKVVVDSRAQVLATGITVDRIGVKVDQLEHARVFHVKHGRIMSH